MRRPVDAKVKKSSFGFFVPWHFGLYLRSSKSRDKIMSVNQAAQYGVSGHITSFSCPYSRPEEKYDLCEKWRLSAATLRRLGPKQMVFPALSRLNADHKWEQKTSFLCAGHATLEIRTFCPRGVSKSPNFEQWPLRTQRPISKKTEGLARN